MEMNELLALAGAAEDDDPGLGAFASFFPRPPARPPVRARPHAPAPPPMLAQLIAQQQSQQAGSPAAFNAALANLFAQQQMQPGVRPGAPGGRIGTLGAAPSFFTFTALSAQTASLVLTPYKSCRPVRLIIDVTVTGSPAAVALLTSAMVGPTNQLLGNGAVAAAAFANNSTVSRISWDIIIPSVPLILNFATSATPAAAPAAITVTPTVYALALG